MKARPALPGYQIAMLTAAIVAAAAFAAFQDGTFINAVFFGKCNVQWSLPPVCQPPPYPGPST
jgi:hypothetical protein